MFYVNTYEGNNEVFKNFADKLGDKLSNNPDIYSSLVCYVLAEKYDKIINMLYNLYNKEVDKTNDKKELLHNLFEQTQLVNKIINNQGFSNEIFNKIIYDYSLLLVEEGLNVEASKYLINIKDSGDEKIMELYERLYYNCQLELGNSLPKPHSKMNIIMLGRTNIKNRNQPQNVNRAMNPQEKTQNKTTGFRPPIRPGQNQTFNRPLPHSNNIDPNIKENRLPPKINEKNSNLTHGPFGGNQNMINQSLSNNPMSPVSPDTTSGNTQNQQFNFGGGNSRITRPPQFKPNIPHRVPNNTITTPPRPITQNINNNIKNMPNQQRIEKPPFPQQMNNNYKEPKIPEKEPEPNNEQNLEPLSQDEQIVYNYYNNCIETYNSLYKDENKRKDFAGKINVLLKKIENHEIKKSLIKYLIEFMNLKEKKDNNGLKRLYTRIQSVDWDKNKSWMPVLDKIINMRV